MTAVHAISHFLQCEQNNLQPMTRLRGMYCRELPDDPQLLETGRLACCGVCGKEGFHSISRIQKPSFWKEGAEMQVGGYFHCTRPLSPILTFVGTDIEPMYHCPRCHLRYLDPVAFADLD